MTLTERFAVIALNGAEVSKPLNVSISTKEYIVIAQLFEFFLHKKAAILNAEEDLSYVAKKREGILKRVLDISTLNSIETCIDSVDNMDKSVLNSYIDELVNELNEDSIIEVIPSLLSCDINYSFSGIQLKQYRSSYTQYHMEIDKIKEDVFRDGDMEDNTVYLLWLLKNNGNINDIFSKAEWEQLENKLKKIYKDNLTINTLFASKLKASMKHSWKAAQKKETIFIETEKMFADADERVANIKTVLEANGHNFELKSSGKIAIAEIDNTLYELVPGAVRQRVINIHGVRLRRYCY